MNKVKKAPLPDQLRIALSDSVNEYKQRSCDSGPVAEAVSGVTWRYVVKDGRSYIEGFASNAAIDSGTTGAITVPEVLGGHPVVGIGNAAFYRCKGLTGVIIGEGVAYIGEEAFRECSGLKEVIIPDNLVAIGQRAFLHCCGLERVYIGKGVGRIDGGAFGGCKNLRIIEVSADNAGFKSLGGALFSKDGSILLTWPGGLGNPEIPSGVTEIGDAAFSWCRGLTDVTIPDGVKIIGKEAFSWCENLVRIDLGNGVERIGDSAFSLCERLKVIKIPDQLRFLGNRVFSNCTALGKVALGKSISSIGDDLFFCCRSLIEVTIPSSVEKIGIRVFYECTKLRQLRVPAVWKGKEILDHVVPEGCEIVYVGAEGELTWHYTVRGEEVELGEGGKSALAQSTSGSITIPDAIDKLRVTAIGGGAFKGCRRLTSVFIPAGITSIADGAFADCDRLQAIEVADDNAVYSSQYGVLFSKDGTVLIAYPGGKTGVYTIPAGVKTLTSGAFAGSKGLTRVVIPDRVTNIGEEAFNGCGALQSIEVSEANPEYSSRDGVLLCKDGRDLVAFPDGKVDGIPSSEPNPLWEVRDRVRNALGKRKNEFDDWANCHKNGGADDLFFFDEVIQVLHHVTIASSFRLAAILQSTLGAAWAEFRVYGDGKLLPIENALCLDGTPESYWEAAVLRFEVSQFYLYWHANYKRMEMVSDLCRFVHTYSFCGYSGMGIFKELPQRSRWDLCKMDFSPEVNLVDDGGIVCYTIFAPFGGFARYCLSIRRKDLGISLSERVAERVPYRCPIRF